HPRRPRPPPAPPAPPTRSAWLPGERGHARSPGAAARMGVGAAPAESPPVLREPREVCAEQHPAYPNHGRGVRPHPARVAPPDRALTSRAGAHPPAPRAPSHDHEPTTHEPTNPRTIGH